MAGFEEGGAEGVEPRYLEQVPGDTGTAGGLGRGERHVGQGDREFAVGGRTDDVDGGEAAEGRDAGRDAERARCHPALDVHLLDALPAVEVEPARAAGHDTEKGATRTGGREPQLGCRPER